MAHRPRGPAAGRGRGKAPTWNPDERYLKIYLKGRAVPFYAPSSYKDVQVEKQAPPPSEKLQLEWVYGYRGRDCRCNLYYLPTGEIVYFTAAVVVLYNVEEQMQRHYTGHTDDVKCLAIHPDKIRIATGQVAGHDRREGKRGIPGGKSKRLPSNLMKFLKEQFKDSKYAEEHFLWPHVRIWDSVSLNTLQVVGIGEFDRAVCCVSFSKVDGGHQLVAVDEANEHVISIWDISRDKAHKVTETKSSTEPVLAAEFHPSEKTSVVTCGKGQISFWTIDGGTLTKKLGIFDKHEKPKYVLSLAFTDNGDTITGDSNGNIFIWGKGGNRITQAINGAHEGGVFSLCMMKDGTLLSGGGKDRKIVQWDSNYKRAGVETEIPEQFGPVRTISQGHGNLILVGTTRNCILQGTLELELQPIVQGHTEELWGLASHPSQQQFLTCAYDKHLYLWDALSHTIIWSKAMEEPAHCCCFHPNGNLAVVGSQSGKWKVIDLTSRDIVAAHSDGTEQIECVQYSPDGQLLALGSRDNMIYIYEVSEDGLKYVKRGRCSGHSSFVTHLDWSENGTYLMTNSGDYEILFWTSSDCKQVLNPSSVRDEVWASQSCTLGFNVAGIWPEGADGTDINGCAASHKRHLVASADDYGKVNLYKYPCFQPKSSGHTYPGHSSHVTNVAFLKDDTRLISTGGKDTSVLQWEVV
ncbi:echinoderm microtubule-associated protein-like 2 isoform X2 [Liolophura sinensis]|uniref:echinoderm microtubule-associated protein-like 2 isoform X2 n=1 Tax=Liolophura sinensis TaxID=3198878 RepID=UPI003158CE63